MRRALRTSARSCVVLSALLAGALAVPAQAADPVYEVHYVDSVDGAKIRVEIARDPSRTDQPVILTYSPYNSLGEPAPADDAIADRYVPRGYARAVADVLGTRGSTGCWDYGGAKEQQSGADVVRWLAKQPWSNGRVGMTGVSYEGTTANMVAALGEEISADSNGGRGLAGIVPIAAISRWYGYAYGDGVRFAGNSEEPTDEGADTPLGFDLGFGRTVPADPGAENLGDVVADRAGECGTVAHTQKGYDTTPDYDAFWKERDYRKDAASFRVPVMVVHGWQDYNVKQEEGTALYEALPVDRKGKRGVPFKKLWMTQSPHANGSGAGYQELLDAFWDHTLKGIDNGVEDRPAVTTRGRSAAGAGAFTTSSAWPPVGTKPLTLHLGRSFDTVAGVPSVGPAGTTGEGGTLRLAPQDSGSGWTHVDDGTVTEEVVLRDPTSRARDVGGQPVRSHGYAWLYHETEPLTSDVRLAGSALLHAAVTRSAAGQALTPVLTEVLPDGTQQLVERGFLNLDYAGGLGSADPRTGDLTATVRFLPQDYTFKKGSRIGLVLMGSNTVWGVPVSGGTLSYAMSGPKATRLVLPVVAAKPSGVLPK